MTRSPTREEAKHLTRRRVLEAAAALLAEVGYAGLSASAVTRKAGIAQPTFYVHFTDKDDLVRSLAAEKIGELRTTLRDARRGLREGTDDAIELVRRTFRVPLVALVEHSALFRLYLQEAVQPGSPFGAQARELRRELERDLVDDLVALGVPHATRAERERVAMTAEGMIALTETLGLRHVEGRYTRLEDVVDVLVAFALAAVPIELSPSSDRGRATGASRARAP